MSGYSFTSRREVAERLSKDAAFLRSCARLLQDRTLNKMGGYMASHRSRASALLGQLDALSDAAVLEQGAWLVAYARTLARLMREEKLKSGDAALWANAAVFGAVPATAVSSSPSTSPTAAPSMPPPAPEAVTPKKKRGRPVGSKNRRKEDLGPPPRRRSRS